MPDLNLATLAAGTVTLAAPLVLAAIGGYASERSGVINIALEGKMLAAACGTALVSTLTGNPALGLTVGLLAAAILCLLHWGMTQTYRIDPIISGMAVNLIAAGGTNFLDAKFSDPSKTGTAPFLPIQLYYVAAVVVPFAMYAYVRWTRPGLRLAAVGSDPDKARLAGVAPIRVRLGALLITAVCTGLAGAMLVTNVGTFTDGMTAGRGYIALAALILGSWRPIPTLVACLAFGLFDALQLQLQGTQLAGAQIPSQFWSALPYVITVIALAGFLGRSQAPAGLGKR